MTTESRGWIFGGYLRPFLEVLAGYVGYAFDDTDWQAVESGLSATDDERPDGWYGYPLVGSRQRTDVRLANAVGGDELSVCVEGVADHQLSVRIDTLFAAYSAASPRSLLH
ncbi:hypothetical protein ABT095_06395 [Kitasatospora sp. NPDC002227]|uniref:hypothetical protein n=1 Tax=Kitasatospora sp. NPDC002227 TaxID=3154773 RepID=UPI00332D2B12